MQTNDQSSPRWADRADRIKASALREIFKAINNPDVISFAGGLPAMDTFPSLTITPQKSALQYGVSEGMPELRELIAKKLSADGLPTSAEKVLILSGSQQGIDLMAKLFVQKHTTVAMESPTYIATLQAFSLYGARFNPFSVTSNTEQDDSYCLTLEQAELSPSVLYTVPTFSNPSTNTYNEAQRRTIANYCKLNNTVLFEDDPYRDICFNNCYRKPISAMMNSGSWVYQSSFSKTVAPGLRIGFLTCSDNLFPKLLHLKQAADLHSCNVSQQILCEYLTSIDFSSRLNQISEHYRSKRDRFEHYLSANFADLAQWSIPNGGFFYWLKMLNESDISGQTLLDESLKSGVAFMPGEAFYPNASPPNLHIRLNFSHAKEEQVKRGLQLLAELFRSKL